MLKLAEFTEREIALVSGLLSLLQEEQQSLKQGNATALPMLGEQKIELIEQLNTLESARAAVLGCNSGDDVRATMEAWLVKHPDQSLIASNWKKLLDLARQAKHEHEVNGQLISMRLQQTNEILTALTNTAPHAALYGSDGQTSQGSGSRIVDSA